MSRTLAQRIGGGIVAALASVAMLFAALPAQAADAWSSLSKTEKLSSYGYFVWKSVHATDANERATAADAANILKNAVLPTTKNIGGAGDATSLENMQNALDQIKNINDYRLTLVNEPCRTDLPANKGRVCDDANRKLTPYKVSDTFMATAQANANYSSTKLDHADNNGQAFPQNSYVTNYMENAAWPTRLISSQGNSGAAELWYSEKPNYDKNPAWASDTGHYISLTNKYAFDGAPTYLELSITGLGVNSTAPAPYDQYGNKTVVQQYVPAKWGYKGYTEDVDSYATDFKSYVALANASTKTITSVQNATLDVASGTAKPTNLPSTVTVTYDDNTTAQVPVTWDAVPNDWNKDRAAHTVKINGTVDGWSKTVTLTLNVAAATVTKATLADGTSKINVTTPSGTSPDTKLPKTGKVAWSNGDTTDETIAWQASAKDQYGKREGNTYDLTGAIAGRTVTAHVTVTPATVQSVSDPAAITVTKGAKPSSIPTTAKVAWSNGETTDEPITWDNGKDPNDATFDQLGAQTFTGTAAGKTVTLTITVVEAKVTKAYDPENITVVSGTEPKLPATVKADLDNGQTKQDVPSSGRRTPCPKACGRR